MKKQTYTAYIILVAAVFSTHPVFALENQINASIADSPSMRAVILGIPTLDNMAGDWIPMEQVENMPAVHNFNHMLVVDRDLTSYFYYPGGIYPWKKGHPITTLVIDGQEYPATETRCFPYKALRRNRYCNGTSVETDLRMINESRM